MRTLLLGMLLSGPALGAEVSGRLLRDGAPEAGAKVSVFGASKLSLPGCEPTPGNDVVGRCRCPDQAAAFTARALAGLEGVSPVTTATTTAVGRYQVPVDVAGPWVVFAVSADSSHGVVLRSEQADFGDAALAPTEQLRLRLEGLSDGAGAWLLEMNSGQVIPLAREGAWWSSPRLPPGPRLLLTVAPGAIPTLQMIHRGQLMPAMFAAEGPAVVVLAAPFELRGRVLDEGRPVAGAEVVADAATCAVRATTDAKGEFRVAAVAAPPFLTTLQANSKGKLAREYGRQDEVVELNLQPAASLELTVVDPKGAPVPGVEVRLRGDPSGAPHPTDARGRWTEADLLGGEVTLAVAAPWVLRGDRKLKLEGAVKKKVVVERGVTLSGRVLDSAGRPAAATVRAFFGDALQLTASDGMKDALGEKPAVADARGEFELKGLVPGEYELEAVSEDEGKATALALAPGTAELRLSQLLAIRGVTVDGEGRPISSATVSTSSPEVPHRSWSALSDSAGRFRLAVGAPGTWALSAWRVPGAPVQQQTVELKSIPGPPLRLVLPEVPPIRGTVVDVGGKPLAGLLVEAVPGSNPQLVMARATRQQLEPSWVLQSAKMMRAYVSTTTDAKGAFSLPLGGEAMVFVTAGDQVEQALGAADAGMRVVVAPRAVATGRVVDEAGAPLSLFTLNGRTVKSPDGSFRATLPKSGKASLRFVADGAVVATRTVPVPAEAVPVELGEVKLAAGYTVRGKVVDAVTGQPLEKSPFLKLAAGEGGAVQPNGTFACTHVPAGPVKLTVSRDGYASAEVSLQPEQPGSVLVKLVRAAELELTVFQAGEPAAGLSVELRGPDGAVRRAGTASDGRATVRELAPGAWEVTAKAVTKRLKLVPGKKAALRLDVPR